jgi:hypothetical protein
LYKRQRDQETRARIAFCAFCRVAHGRSQVGDSLRLSH